MMRGGIRVSIGGTILAMAVFCAQPCLAAIELLAPTNGATVAIVPEAQKKVMSLPTLDERIKLFAEDRAHGKVIRHDKYWRKSLPFVLKWRTTSDKECSCKVEIGKSPDLSDARVWYVKMKKVDEASGRETGGNAFSGGIKSFTVPLANLEIAQRYYWRITTRGRCGTWNCGIHCPCKSSKILERSEIASFVTEDFAPRWIEIEGRAYNMRDLGGRLARDGRRVRQGMIIRGQGLNDNSATGEVPGRNRLTVEDVKYLTGTLGIRTDLDLRGVRETADMKESPLGKGVNLIISPFTSYDGIFKTSGKEKMARVFRVFCDRENYPVYVHCIGGADRTGALAYVLNGVLGVNRQGIETDWESTFYPNIPDADHGPTHWCREGHFNEGFVKYGKEGDSWNKRIELYLLDCGITEGEIATFREIMLEPCKAAAGD